MIAMASIAHIGFAAALARRAETHGPVTIGIAGAGQMGTDIVVEAMLMPGVRVGAISEVRGQAALDAALMAGHERSRIVTASTAADIDRAIEGGASPSPMIFMRSAPLAALTW